MIFDVVIKDIVFDFDSDENVRESYAASLQDSYHNHQMRVDIEEGHDLNEVICNMISKDTGWCVSNVNYVATRYYC